MKASDVLELALKKISREDILNTTLFGKAETVSDEQQSVVDDLVVALGDTISSIAFLYHPLKKVENITVQNGQFDFSELSRTLIEVIRLKRENGTTEKFTTFPSFFTAPNGNYTITYTYAPSTVIGLEDVVEVPNGKVDARAISTGCVSRFYLKRGMYQDANVWDVAFQRLMLVGQRSKALPSMPKRGWY